MLYRVCPRASNGGLLDRNAGRYWSKEKVISNAISRGATHPRSTHLRIFTPGAFFSSLKKKIFHQALRHRAVRFGVIASNVAILLAVVSIVILNSAQPGNAAHSLALQNNTTEAQTPVDQVASVDIAATVANMTDMLEAPEVNGQALAEKVQSQSGIISQGETVAKSQVVGSAFVSNKDIKTYVVQPGDTINALAAKFGVSTNSIRWSNGLSFYASLTTGKVLLIPPVDGIVYKVKAGDTAQSLAQSYAASEALIIADNDAELHGLTPGEQIIIPGGTMPQPSYAPSYGGYGYFANIAGTYDMYAKWNCTWWVAYRWAQTGRPIMPLLGNASQWYYNAQRLGMATGHVPRQYAAAVTSTYGYGHVVFVEGVNADGSINISEMNVNGANTWYPVDPTVTRSTVPASTAARYLYIY